MRPIKFRGKQIENGEWVFGYYTKSPKGNVYITPFRVGMPIKVDPDTVGQYTGLKAFDDVKIYEGDIVKITGEHKPGIYYVIWDIYRVAFWLKNVKQRELQYDDDYYQLLDNCWEKDGREVIGNIYDNPELWEDNNGRTG